MKKMVVWSTWLPSVYFVNVHLRTPRNGLQAVLDPQTLIDSSKSPCLQVAIQLRRQKSGKVVDWINQFSHQVIIAGDFNMPVDSDIYHQTWSKYGNAFSTAGLGFGYTKTSDILGWQYGSRIDHILSGRSWRPCRCWIGPDVGSDHLPLVADLSCQGQ
jgi:endonuclease/exonuclease/phosphatase (EEP) superfamily protein YafD